MNSNHRPQRRPELVKLNHAGVRNKTYRTVCLLLVLDYIKHRSPYRHPLTSLPSVLTAPGHSGARITLCLKRGTQLRKGGRRNWARVYSV